MAKLKLEKTVNIAGFYMPTKKEKSDSEKTTQNDDSVTESVQNLSLNESQTNETNEQTRSLDESSAKKRSESADENNNNNEASVNEGEEQSGEEEDSDEEGWIKPSNLEEVKKMSMVEADQRDIKDLNLKVACMTSDFAMQVRKIHIISKNSDILSVYSIF